MLATRKADIISRWKTHWKERIQRLHALELLLLFEPVFRISVALSELWISFLAKEANHQSLRRKKRD